MTSPTESPSTDLRWPGGTSGSPTRPAAATTPRWSPSTVSTSPSSRGNRRHRRGVGLREVDPGMSALRLLPHNATLTGTVRARRRGRHGDALGPAARGALDPGRDRVPGRHELAEPGRTVGWQIAEALELHGTRGHRVSAARAARIRSLLEMVDLPAREVDGLPARAVRRPEAAGHDRHGARLRPGPHHRRRAHHGPRRRSSRRRSSTCSRPWSATRALTLVMISHDLSVLAAVCDRIVVMQHGRIVEEGPAHEVMVDPQHAHTRELAAAFPEIGDPASRRRVGTGRPHSRWPTGPRRRRPTSRRPRCWRWTTWSSTSWPAASGSARSTM